MANQNDRSSIDAQAAEWASRVLANDLSDADRQGLDAWLDSDRRHRGAFARARAVWVSLRHLEQNDTALEAAPRLAAPNRRALLVGGGLLAASLGAGVLVLPALRSRELYATGVGEVRRLPLADGSTALLNTQSRLDIGITAKERVVELQNGEVWFEVRARAHKPFLVMAGALRVMVADAAAFAVRKTGAEVLVTVTQGVVEAWTQGADAKRRTIQADSTLAFGARDAAVHLVRLSSETIGRRLAWRDGLIILDGETIGEAVEEFNRYNEHKLAVVGAPATNKVVGVFKTNDPEAFAQAMRALFNLAVEQTGNRTVLLAK